MDNFKFSLLLRGQLESLSIDNNISSFVFKMLPCYEEFFFFFGLCSHLLLKCSVEIVLTKLQENQLKGSTSVELVF